MYIDRDKHYAHLTIEACDNKPASSIEPIVQDTERLLTEYGSHVKNHSIQFAATWLLEKDIYLQSENRALTAEEKNDHERTLSRGRVVLVNPGVTGVGREQKYIHPFIVLGEHKGMFIGVPITNMAQNKKTGEYYLRNFFEVELVDPNTKKPFTEFRCKKPSVADLRNISGLDKRRITRDIEKFVPKTYLDAISHKIRGSIAIL